MATIELYNILKQELPKSTAKQRKAWATIIVEENLSIINLSKLLQCERQVATRFLWLLSDIGEVSPSILHQTLPFLFSLRDGIKDIDTEASFANYWLIAGVPHVNEVQAIDLLFDWLQSANTNVTAKSRSLFVLYNLTEKYPELKIELKACLEYHKDKSTKDFHKRAEKILKKLG